jgi:hypothetical protein
LTPGDVRLDFGFESVIFVPVSLRNIEGESGARASLRGTMLSIFELEARPALERHGNDGSAGRVWKRAADSCMDSHEEQDLDKLDVIQLAEERGGTDRRKALEHVMITARNLGCDADIGGGRAGGINFRYGSIRYAIMDVNTKGLVKLYVQPHPGKDAPDQMKDGLNDFIGEMEALEPKSFPINSYGHLEDKVEDIPNDDLDAFLEESVRRIREVYYRKHMRD